ncbi:hypothetical protein BV212_04910 [Pasteurella multocida]|nr:hypothetical protein BV212_04910 [Pasteurella multocida]KWW10790.1 hypothetical protein VM82_06555 [Pasteurella multocida]
MKNKKIRFKKIRGINRRLNAIKKWKNENIYFDQETLFNQDCLYVKFWVDPWSRLALKNIQYCIPAGKIREIFIQSLIEIYDEWKIELEKLQIKYYLKIWIDTTSLKNSQVVCAINDKIDWYQNLFFKGNNTSFPIDKFPGEIKKTLKSFNWAHYSYEELIDEDYIGNEKDYSNKKDYLSNKKWYEQFLASKHRIIHTDNQSLHFLKISDIWVGEK